MYDYFVVVGLCVMFEVIVVIVLVYVLGVSFCKY